MQTSKLQPIDGRISRSFKTDFKSSCTDTVSTPYGISSASHSLIEV